MQAIVHPADIQDRDGGMLLMSSLLGLFPSLLKLYADSGYQGPKFKDGLAHVCKQVSVEIVKRSDADKFVVLPSAGLSSARLPGSTVAAVWPRIGSASTETPSRSYAGHASE